MQERHKAATKARPVAQNAPEWRLIMEERKVRYRSILKKIKGLAAVFIIMCILTAFGGCDKENANALREKITEKTEEAAQKHTTEENEKPEQEQTTEETVNPTQEQTTEETVKSEQEKTTEETTEFVQEETTEKDTEAIQITTQNTETPYGNVDRIVAIDAGHQSRGNSEKEPIGPGSDIMKAKVAGGTSGVVTGKPEYELTLEISLKLKQELENRGYTVIMIRETNDVNISNAERAQIANTSGATSFLRIHADGSDNNSVSGATTLCPTPQNPYCSSIYEESRRLSEAVLNNLCESTGCRKRNVSEVDNMSGINWCQIPVSIVEVGFMTNDDEDKLLSTEEYQWKVARGIADGVDEFYSQNDNIQ